MTAGGRAAAAGRIDLNGRARPSLPLLGACCLASGLVLLPLLVTIGQAAGAGVEMAVALLWRPLVGELLSNTLLLIAATTLCCGVIGTALAWAVERTDLPGRRGFAVLAVVPLAIPPFITSYAWVSLEPGLADFSGALLVVTVSYYPLVYLPVAAALREMDPALEETARALGNTPWAVFYRVVLPQLRPALLGGMLLVALIRWWNSGPLRCCGSARLRRRFIPPTGPGFRARSRLCCR